MKYTDYIYPISVIKLAYCEMFEAGMKAAQNVPTRNPFSKARYEATYKAGGNAFQKVLDDYDAREEFENSENPNQ
jgi:hypothetical protein